VKREGQKKNAQGMEVTCNVSTGQSEAKGNSLGKPGQIRSEMEANKPVRWGTRIIGKGASRSLETPSWGEGEGCKVVAAHLQEKKSQEGGFARSRGSDKVVHQDRINGKKHAG